MRMKAGVLLALSPSMARALPLIEACMERVTGADLVITSASDGVHSAGSRHYTGEALDIRVYTVDPGKRERLVRALRAVLGLNFDVVLEVDHVHVEFDPEG